MKKKKNKETMITDQTLHALNSLFSDLPREQMMQINIICEAILSNIDGYSIMTDYKDPVRKAESIFLSKVSMYKEEDQMIMKRATIAKLALNLPNIVGKLRLPVSILKQYPDAFKRLAEFLKTNNDGKYDSAGEFFCKDMRFVLGLSIPNGVLVFDVNSRISVASVMLSVIRSGKINGLIQYMRAEGHKLWFRGHLDSRYTDEVNESGYDKFYCRLAEMLEMRKDIKGFVGTTWLHAPELPEVSPHLAFFMKPLREGGAFLLRHGTESSDIQNALKKSEKRRRLYKEGKYVPVSYSMIWPRKYLIAWAAQARQDKSLHTSTKLAFQ